MKRFHRRCRRLCILAALLVLLVLFLRQNVLLDTTSRHAILLDAQSGQVLAQKRADERTAPASLTKMMTILLAIEAEPDLDKQVTLPEGIFPALQIERASMAGFAPGETVTVRDLLYGAMLPSGAECCETLARLVSGSEDNFAALMNQKAAELGMKNTHFTNPTGCGGQVIEARVQDYLARYDVPAREAIDVRWAQTCMALEDTVERLEEVLSPVLVRRMQAKLWQALYFGYDYAQDYLPQLEANLQTLDTELHKLTEYQKKRNNHSK